MAVAAREGQHVSRVVLAPKLAIQLAKLGVAGDQAIEATSLGHLALELSREPADVPLRCVRHRTAERDATAIYGRHGLLRPAERFPGPERLRARPASK